MRKLVFIVFLLIGLPGSQLLAQAPEILLAPTQKYTPKDRGTGSKTLMNVVHQDPSQDLISKLKAGSLEFVYPYDDTTKQNENKISSIDLFQVLLRLGEGIRPNSPFVKSLAKTFVGATFKGTAEENRAVATQFALEFLKKQAGPGPFNEDELDAMRELLDRFFVPIVKLGLAESKEGFLLEDFSNEVVNEIKAKAAANQAQSENGVLTQVQADFILKIAEEKALKDEIEKVPGKDKINDFFNKLKNGAFKFKYPADADSLSVFDFISLGYLVQRSGLNPKNPPQGMGRALLAAEGLPNIDKNFAVEGIKHLYGDPPVFPEDHQEGILEAYTSYANQGREAQGLKEFTVEEENTFKADIRTALGLPAPGIPLGGVNFTLPGQGDPVGGPVVGQGDPVDPAAAFAAAAAEKARQEGLKKFQADREAQRAANAAADRENQRQQDAARQAQAEAQAKALAGIGAAMAKARAEAEAAASTETYTVWLTGHGGKMIDVIKAVRPLTALKANEAKDLVEGSASVPAQVNTGLSKADADDQLATLVAAGATGAVQKDGDPAPVILTATPPAVDPPATTPVDPPKLNITADAYETAFESKEATAKLKEALDDEKFKVMKGSEEDGVVLGAVKQFMDVYALNAKLPGGLLPIISYLRGKNANADNNAPESIQQIYKDSSFSWVTAGIPLTSDYPDVEAATKRCIAKIEETPLKDKDGNVVQDDDGNDIMLGVLFQRPSDKHSIYATLRKDVEKANANNSLEKVYCGAIFMKRREN